MLNKKSKGAKKNKYTEKASLEKSVKKKKDKKTKNKDLDLMMAYSKKNNADEEIMLIETVSKPNKNVSKGNSGEDVSVNHARSSKTDKHKKSKKETKDKESKKKSTKKGMFMYGNIFISA